MIQDSIKNTLAASAHSLSRRRITVPQYNGDKQFEYYKDESRRFIEDIAQYANDYVEADIQGLEPSQPFEYTRVHIRLADIVKPSAATENEWDDFKEIMIAEKEYWYIRTGAKVITMGSTWLVTNTNNMSTGNAAVIQRCNATWRYLDYYGNVCYEPFCVPLLRMRANDPDSQRSTMITKGYFDAKMQYNEASKNLRNNARMILGSAAYMISGYADFDQEFTDDDNSVNLIAFTLRYEEPNMAIDDMVNRVAGGKTFKWDITLNGEASLNVGQTTQLTASSSRMDEVVESTEEYPVSYVWSSSDESIATVDETGLVTATGEGNAEITCSLEQNTDKSTVFEIKVAGELPATRVAFDTSIPATISLYEAVEISASYYENWEQTEESIAWVLSGANSHAYSAETNGNTITIKCWDGSEAPLTVTAMYGEYTATANIILEGI